MLDEFTLLTQPKVSSDRRRLHTPFRFLQKSAGFIYNELLREIDTNTFYLIEDWESQEALNADAAGDHTIFFLTEMGVMWGEMEFGTDKAVTMTLKSMKTVPIV